MIQYLSGAINGTVLANPRVDLGLMIQPGMGNGSAPLMFWDFGADNGCFARGDKFNAGDWLAWLGTLAPYAKNMLFAVAPDVYMNADATLARSLPHIKTIRNMGYPPAFVSQNGCRSDIVPWGDIDCLFVGGDDEWKLGPASWELCHEAKRRGKRVHVGRVNSFKRLQLCAKNDVDSADGTYLKYGPDVNWPKMISWLDRVNNQLRLDI